MGKDLAEKFPSAKAWFDRANAALGYDLAGVCFKGPEADLTKTENAQPGIFLVSWVAFQLLKEQAPHLKFDATAGLSLGEFTALTAAGAMSFEDGLRVVRQILDGIDRIRFFDFSDRDVVRHPVVQRIVTAYERSDRERAPRSGEAGGGEGATHPERTKQSAATRASMG